jgi:hypothetical protein
VEAYSGSVPGVFQWSRSRTEGALSQRARTGPRPGRDDPEASLGTKRTGRGSCQGVPQTSGSRMLREARRNGGGSPVAKSSPASPSNPGDPHWLYPEFCVRGSAPGTRRASALAGRARRRLRRGHASHPRPRRGDLPGDLAAGHHAGDPVRGAVSRGPPNRSPRTPRGSACLRPCLGASVTPWARRDSRRAPVRAPDCETVCVYVLLA